MVSFLNPITDLGCTCNAAHIFNVPGDGIKRDPERENCAMLTIAAQMANLIHIWVTFNAVTRYSLILALQSLLDIFGLFQQNSSFLHRVSFSEVLDW